MRKKIWACEDFIYIPPIEILTRPHIIRRLAIVLKNLMYVSRQKRAAQFKDVLLSYQGDVFDPEELWFDHLKICPWHVLGVTNSKYELEGDTSAWWIGAFLRFADNEPKIVTPKNLSRYELIYLVIAIKYPHLINKILA
ncbi:MAG: hypothetical protein J0L55_14920 [Caulobacterales bacterium]|nr:hypothetical protein [Caulobacterales bacterium]